MVEFAAMDHPTGWIIGPGDPLGLILAQPYEQVPDAEQNQLLRVLQHPLQL